ncbi:hypothetical protein BCR37DRAFT_63207 [Protomyces lactucae-debilis]|uniref:Uncharacterized protein n=1 Tax=Protomyces lactucae-debilis TaxID=2754530 RepID=A0A1Y2FAS8_PROLT|nr:uncharacterized protein BCR37DRAFT_63207 [Protomyces lactucae-debilis]ORY81019.1 hypothetical protein BCR37DRAFT_63207 [Protomyces lactucae-debilis]
MPASYKRSQRLPDLIPMIPFKIPLALFLAYAVAVPIQEQGALSKRLVVGFPGGGVRVGPNGVNVVAANGLVNVNGPALRTTRPVAPQRTANTNVGLGPGSPLFGSSSLGGLGGGNTMLGSTLLGGLLRPPPAK